MDNQVKAVMQCKLDSNLSFKAEDMALSGLGSKIGDFPNSGGLNSNPVLTGWGWWKCEYYPKVIRESYPVYIQERAQDKGKQAFEIIKALQDKKLMRLETVADFIEAMDTLIKTL